MERIRTGDGIVRAIDALPVLPAAAFRVMQVAQDPNASASDLALVVSTEPGLSARILRVANSPAYRRSRQVTSVREALVVLGFVQARNIAVTTAIATAYAPDSLNALFRIDRFWRHSIAVAFQASELAAQSRRMDVPTAFTAGILHDMGRLAMFHADPAAVDQAVVDCMRYDQPLHEVERDTLGYDHAEVGGLLAERWNLPPEVRDAIARHHGDAGPELNLASAIAAADEQCIACGILPGYVLPGATHEPWSAAFARVMRQVDSLMQLVAGEPVGVRLVG